MKCVEKACVVMLIILTSSFSGASSMTETSQNNTVRFLLSDIALKKNTMELAYRIENLADSDIWVCTDNNFKSSYPTFESLIAEDAGRLTLKVKNFMVPKNMYLEEPIFAKFKKIRPKDIVNLRLKLEFPVREYSPISTDKTKKMAFRHLRSIEMAIGYYEIDLEKMKSCCMKTSRDDELLVSCFWAENNLERELSVTISKELIEKRLLSRKRETLGATASGNGKLRGDLIRKQGDVVD